MENLTNKELEAIRHIRSHLIQHGRVPSVRGLMTAMEYRSPRSASMIFEKLADRGILERKPDRTYAFHDIDDATDENRTQTVDIPLIGRVSCGSPIFADENIEAFYKVSNKMVTQNQKYFLLRAQGDSMDQAGIDDGDLVLIKQQNTANNGDRVLALIDDEATIKEFQQTPDCVILRPRSSNSLHNPIILTHDFQIQGVVMSVLPSL